jgi:phosphoribosyl 1,2-cyclic phosphodiesterase
MKVVALQSGSNGNCVYVASRGVRLLIDAGISGKRAERRLADCGGEIRNGDAVVLTHDHADHAKCAGIYHRKFGLPIYATRRTLTAADARHALGPIGEVHRFRAGEPIRFGPVTVETIPTPHDGADGVALVIDDGRVRLGVLTDLGHVFEPLPGVLASLDALILESNYDPDMLAAGPYPGFLKARIRGAGGHLSNVEAGELVRRVGPQRFRWICLGHLSEQNNRPELALETHRAIVGASAGVYVASRHEATVLPEL